jgi:trehalose 6-phosphate synthase
MSEVERESGTGFRFASGFPRLEPNEFTRRRNERVQNKETALRELCNQVLKGKRLVLASNRGPVTYERNEQGELVKKRGSGGVVTALLSLTRYTPVTWVAAALSETDREIAQSESKGQDLDAGENLRLRFVNIDQDSFDKYLNVISNPLLWFVQHEMDDLLQEENLKQRDLIFEAWREGYVTANQEFAKAVVEEAEKEDAAPFVILHDYQLYLAPGMVRQQKPDAVIMHFTHIPWPEPEIWQSLPAGLVKAICDGLLDCNLVGFQTSKDVRAFVNTCEEYLSGVTVEEEAGGGYRVERAGQINTQIKAYPISIDPAEVRKTYQGKAAQQWREKLSDLRQSVEKLIVRVDRVDPNKNIITGFEAYRELLRTAPEWQSKVSFLALLVPTRESVPEYAAYRDQTFALIEEINKEFGNPESKWKPVEYFYGNDYGRALAALSMAEVVLVNSLADGMNLVAKEASVVNERNSVLILSYQAGAWEELQDGAIGIDPADVDATREALVEALAMPEEERRARAVLLSQTIENNDLSNWLAAQLADLGHFQAAPPDRKQVA